MEADEASFFLRRSDSFRDFEGFCVPMERLGSGVFVDFRGLLFLPKQLKIDWMKDDLLIGPEFNCN